LNAHNEVWWDEKKWKDNLKIQLNVKWEPTHFINYRKNKEKKKLNRRKKFKKWWKTNIAYIGNVAKLVMSSSYFEKKKNLQFEF
jgi:hypothetical protein